MARRIGKPVPVKGGGNLMLDTKDGAFEVRIVKTGTQVGGTVIEDEQTAFGDGCWYLTRKGFNKVFAAVAEMQRGLVH